MIQNKHFGQMHEWALHVWKYELFKLIHAREMAFALLISGGSKLQSFGEEQSPRVTSGLKARVTLKLRIND